MRAAIYARVSTDTQSTDLQLRDLEAYAKARSLTVVETFQDIGISGSKDRRPALDKLMQAVRKRKVDLVLVWRFDRFARSSSHLAKALDEFKGLGVQFISYSENIDTLSPIGQAMFTMISAMAQLERDIIKERVKAGLETAKSKGVVLGRKKTVDEKEVKKLLEKGLSYRVIAKELNISIASVARAK
jgi:DNA invertase Pin-like site-specific DNA recombinase